MLRFTRDIQGYPVQMQRYSQGPFPPYRYTPGVNPHPSIDPQGHSYGLPESAIHFDIIDWQASEEYKYGIDLINAGYYWEAHEVLEGIWHHLGRKNQHAQSIQTLILLAVACLHLRRQMPSAQAKVASKGLARLAKIQNDFFGCQRSYIESCLQASLRNEAVQPQIKLQHL